MGSSSQQRQLIAYHVEFTEEEPAMGRRVLPRAAWLFVPERETDLRTSGHKGGAVRPGFSSPARLTWCNRGGLAGFSSRGEAATVQWASRLLARSSREGAAAGVYHTPEGSPPGGACLDQGPGFYTCPPWDWWSMTRAE